jgi:hypothetical protein
MSYIIDILPSPFFTVKSNTEKRYKQDDLQELEEIVLCEKNHTAIDININDSYFAITEANNVSQTIFSFLQEQNKKDDDIDLLDFDEIDSLLNLMTIEELDEMIKKCEEVVETI